MALNAMGLGFVFTLKDYASSGLSKLERRFSSLDEQVTGGSARMSSALSNTAVGLGTLAVGATTLSGAFSLAESAGRFEQGLAAVGAVTRATTQELDGLREAAIQAGIQTQFSPDEAVEGLQSLVTAGQTAEQATQSLVPVLDLAAGSLGQLGVAQAAEAVVGTLNAYGISASQAAGVTDKLLRITQLTNFQSRDFEAGLSKAAATGAVYKQSMNDVLITMGLLRNRNIDASSSATAFREAVRRVGSESRAQKAVLGAHVEIFDQYSGKMRSIVDIMSDFAEATKDMTDAERNRRVNVAFGARGLNAFNAVMNASFMTTRDGEKVLLKGAEAIQALRNEMNQTEGTAAEFRGALLDTFAGQMTLLSGTLQTFAVTFGEPFTKVFKPIVGTVVEGLNAILRGFDALPESIKTTFAAVTVSAGGFALLVGSIVAVKGAAALASLAMGALGVSIGGIVTALGPVALAVGALVAAVYYAFQTDWSDLVGWSKRVGEQVTSSFQKAWGGFKGFFDRAFGPIIKSARNALTEFDRMASALLSRLADGMTTLSAAVSQAFEYIVHQSRALLRLTIDGLNELDRQTFVLLNRLVEGMGALPSILYQSFKYIAHQSLELVKSVADNLNTIFSHVENKITEGVERLRQAFSQLSTWLSNGVDAMMTSLKTGFESLLSYMTPLLDLLPSSISFSGGATSTGAKATSKTTRTLSSPMPAVVAETQRKHELVQLRASQQALIRQLRRQAPSTSSTIQVAVQLDGETIARAVHKANQDASARTYAALPSY